MTALLQFTFLEMKISLRNVTMTVASLVLPVMILLIMGGIYGNKPMEGFGYGMLDVSAPAYAGLVITFTAILRLPLAVCQYRERKVLKRLMATPAHPRDLLISQFVVMFLITLLGMALLVAAGKLVYNMRLPSNPMAVLGAFSLSVLALFALGFVIASVAKDSRTANAIGMIIQFPIIFLSGATIPAEGMTGWLKTANGFIPLSYGIDLMKGAWLGRDLFAPGYLLDMAVLSGMALVFGALSLAFFRWGDER